VTDGAEITLRDLWLAQQTAASSTQTQLASIGAQVAQLATEMHIRLSAAEATPKVTSERIDKLERRVSRNEAFRIRLAAIGSMLAVVSGVAAAWVEHLLSH
jgi:hypothetical protein